MIPKEIIINQIRFHNTYINLTLYVKDKEQQQKEHVLRCKHFLKSTWVHLILSLHAFGKMQQHP